MVDLGAYNEQALGILEGQLQSFLLRKEYFNEGDGVLVFELAQPEAIAALPVKEPPSPPNDSDEE